MMRTRRLMGFAMFAGFLTGMMLLTAYIIVAVLGPRPSLAAIFGLGIAILAPLQAGLLAIALPLIAMMDGDDDDRTDER